MNHFSNSIKVPVTGLELGMFVCELDRPWSETPFIFQGFLLQSARDIEAVCEHCNYVYIDPKRGHTKLGESKRLWLCAEGFHTSYRQVLTMSKRLPMRPAQAP